MYLLINPGSTSTKIGVSVGQNIGFTKTIRHTQEELSAFKNVVDQKEYRTDLVIHALAENNIPLSNLKIIIAIGGLIAPGDAAVYKVGGDLVQDMMEARYDEHASNLGALIAYALSEKTGAEAYIADAITVDEMDDIARISGIPEITRRGRAHTLNQKYTAKIAAGQVGKAYENSHLIVAHLGGGISVVAHRDGRMVDTNAARGEGPFCIDRSGGVNAFELAKMCFSGKFSREELLKKINGNGGVVAYLGTRNFLDVEAALDRGDKKAQAVFDAMSYQISKEIASMTVPLQGKVDAIVLTGGMANSKRLCSSIAGQVGHLAEVLIYPGENEMNALAEYADLIAAGKLIPREYHRRK